jgi:hypothetical protein
MVEWFWKYIVKCENWYCGRKYSSELKVQNAKRVDFSCLQGRGWIRVVVFLDHLGELPSFPTWIQIIVASTLIGGETIDQDTIHMSMPPTLEDRSYWSMYAFGNHIHVASVEEHLTTCDSGVVATFEQACVLRPNDQILVM